ncbi:XrtA/PEP-CTERM system TPR-repeat protein PrsT [Neptunomonas qingdaonensis]|uniref:Putative PEP-CTERM system TPR-repeat lipoprotein n=1 Tax=Neptunomonas qingdaonensis TaxID=1045558 RepID=A0A1I2MSS6_9GAMM|nr:XrtA/PEP-CTERM system TPR-repeat protein PrsT [Neptunomonas qingdaonensis]SFF94584.1 putative PEP-CTERM system TPR-repeat lipoprotein [Neptunomonas qingdaonensis]
MKAITMNKKCKHLATAITVTSILLLPIAQGTQANSDAVYMQEVNSYLQQGKSNAAIIVLKNVLQKDPKDAGARLILGNIYRAQGNIPAAEKEINEAHTLNPDDPDTSIAYSKFLLQNNKLKELESILSNTEGWSDEQLIEAYILQTQANVYRGNIAEAEKKLDQAVQLDPNKPIVLFSQAVLEIQRRQPDDAKKYLEQLLATEPDHVQGLMLVGELAMAKQDYPLAIQTFESASKKQPNIGIANISLAQALIADNQLEKATLQLQKVLDIDPGHPDANALQAKIEFTNKRFRESTQYAEAGLSQSEKNTELVYIAAASYYATDRYEIAYAQIKKVLARYPGHVESLKLKAAIELKLDLINEATATLSQINNESFKESDDQLLIATGIASLKDKDYISSKRLLDQASNLQSADPRVSLGQATIAAIEGDHNATIKALETAIEKSPDSQQAQTALILTYLQDKQFDKALERAIQFSLDHPKNPNGETFKGLSYVMLKDFSKAAAAFNAALAIEPGNPNASHNLASIIKRQDNDTKKIRAIHENVLKLHPDNLNSLIELSILDQSAGEHDNATQRLEHAIKTTPDAPRPYLILSTLYLQQNKLAQSLAVSEQALKINPDNPGFLTLAGKAQQMSGQYDTATDYYTKAIAVAPEAVMPHYLLGQLYQQTNQLTLAEATIDKTLSLMPDHLGALLIKAQLNLKSGNLENAKSIATQLKEADPENSYITELHAQIAYAEKDLDTAATLYKKVLSERKNSALNIQLASVLWQQPDKKEEATSLLTQWLDKNPADTLTRNVLATLYLQDKQTDNAISEFTKIVKLTPNNSTAHNNLAWLLFQRNDISAAEDHAKKANELNPNNPLIMDTLGTILMQKGELLAAEKLLADASTLLPENPEILFHLAQVNFKAGQKTQSEVILIELLSEKHATAAFSEREDAKKMLNAIQSSK